MQLFSSDIKTLNYYAAWVHGLSFVGVLGAFLAKNEEVNFSTEVFRLKIVDLQKGDREATLEAQKVGKVPTEALKTAILLMFIITCIFHIFYYTDGFNSGLYTEQIRNKRNLFRWLEYGVTSTIMIFVLSIMSGVKSSDQIFTLCSANLILMSLGYFIEVSPTKRDKIVGLIMGFYLLFSIWYVILSNFFRRINEVEDLDNPNKPSEKRQIAGWVKQVLVPMFFWYLSFGIVSTLYVKNYDKPGFDFKMYERYYIILSYLSKAFMGYYLAFGLTRPKSEDAS